MDVAPQYEAFSYQRRVKEQTLLYRVLAGNLETFLDRRRSEEHELPRYVETVLAGMTAASVRGLVATGDRGGFRVRRVLTDPAEAVRTGELCYASRGFSALSIVSATRVS
jgi:hypothetical protein